MVIPSGPRNARALLVSAIRDPDPVIFFEHKGLYHAAKEDVPDEIETMPLGRAQVVREGSDLTLIAYGAMLRLAREAADTLAEEDGAQCEVIDLLTISPLDRETLVASVQKTGRAVIVHEAPRSFGPGAEIATSIMDGAFLSLEAPIARVTSWDVPFPGFARERATSPICACWRRRARRWPSRCDGPGLRPPRSRRRPHRGGDPSGAGARGRRGGRGRAAPEVETDRPPSRFLAVRRPRGQDPRAPGPDREGRAGAGQLRRGAAAPSGKQAADTLDPTRTLAPEPKTVVAEADAPGRRRRLPPQRPRSDVRGPSAGHAVHATSGAGAWRRSARGERQRARRARDDDDVRAAAAGPSPRAPRRRRRPGGPAERAVRAAGRQASHARGDRAAAAEVRAVWADRAPGALAPATDDRRADYAVGDRYP
jgi:hypothetical protein